MALTEEQLELLGEQLVPLFQTFERAVINDIARRLAKTGRLTETAEIMAETLRDKGFSPDAIRVQVMREIGANEYFQREIAQNTLAAKKVLEAEIEALHQGVTDASGELWEEAGNMAFHNDLSVWQSDRKPVKGSAFERLVGTMRKRATAELLSLTRSTGFHTAAGVNVRAEKMYQHQLNVALTKVSSGAYSYNQAIEEAVRELARSGLRTVEFESGVTRQIDTAVRNAVMTSSAQLAGEISMQNVEDTDVEYVEVSAHWGAREGEGHANHAGWQGQVYRVNGSDEQYQNLEEVTGYPSDPAGLLGYNCRHAFYPFWPGISTPNEWPPEPGPVEVNGRTYTYYQATQEQRKREREIRALKREKSALEAAGLKENAAAVGHKIKSRTAEYEDFSEAVGIRAKTERLRVCENARKTTNVFLTYEDPIREKIGAAINSHPKEIEEIKKYLESVGVSIKYREQAMAYMPSAKLGKPGEFVIDPEASYSAWMHEKNHVEDDELSGWNGMYLLCDPYECAKMEEHAYNIEIDIAREYGYNDIVERLEALKEARLREVMEGVEE